MAGVLLFSFPFVFFIGHFPTLKKTARRMDEMGLKDRTVTMLENENNQSVMARLQREDAKKQMGSLRARKMKLRLSGKVLAALLCLSVLTSGLFALPHDLLRFGKEASAEGMDEEQQQIIKDLIDKLRDETEKSPLDEELQEEVEYSLVGSNEANPLLRRISDQSPVGRALMGTREGAVLHVNTPAGELVLRVLEVTRAKN
jgi:hypothetical protein